MPTTVMPTSPTLIRRTPIRRRWMPSAVASRSSRAAGHRRSLWQRHPEDRRVAVLDVLENGLEGAAARVVPVKV
jgi:hypothetical protein